MLIFTILSLVLSFLPATAGSITGKVIDSITRDPIAGASVFLTEPACSTQTATNGEFVLELPETRIIVPVKPRVISFSPANIFFDLSGRKLPEKKVFPAGIILQKGQKGRKILFLPGMSAPSLSGMAATTMTTMKRKTASSELRLNVSKDGYQPALRSVEDGGDVGEILLSPRVKTTIYVVLGQFGFVSINNALPMLSTLPSDSVKVSLLSGSDGPLIMESMVPVDGSSDTIKVSCWLEPKKKYKVLVSQGANRCLREGSALYDILEADTSVSVFCKACQAPFNCSVDLKNSVFTSEVIGVKLKCSVVQSGGAAPYSFSLKKDFEVGTMDEVLLNDTLAVGYAWDLDLTILCEDTSVVYSESIRTPVLAAGQNYDLSIVPSIRDGK